MHSTRPGPSGDPVGGSSPTAPFSPDLSLGANKEKQQHLFLQDPPNPGQQPPRSLFI